MRSFILTQLILFAANQAVAGEDTLGLSKRIIKSNRDYLSSMISFEVNYQSRDIERPGDPVRIHPQVTWARSHNHEVVFTDPAFDGYAGKFNRIWSCFDGKKRKDLSFSVSNPRRVIRMDVAADYKSPMLQDTFPARALGWSCMCFEPILAMMEEADHREITREPAILWYPPNETVSFPALKWKLKKLRRREDLPEHEAIVWISEEHSWLPRMITVHPVGLTESKVSVTLPEGAAPYMVAVIDFAEVDDQLTGRTRYFPSTICSLTLEWMMTKVTSISVNRPVAAEQFEPTLNTGTLIVHDAGTHSERREYVGGVDGEKCHLEMLDDDREYLGMPTSKHSMDGEVSVGLAKVDARPHAAGWNLSLAISALLILLSIGVIWVRLKSF